MLLPYFSDFFSPQIADVRFEPVADSLPINRYQHCYTLPLLAVPRLNSLNPFINSSTAHQTLPGIDEYLCIFIFVFRWLNSGHCCKIGAQFYNHSFKKGKI